ncbi:MAG: transposase [Ignavibacteria bacterium]|nr:transposase [Ignavibacteria bacterium]
MEKGKRGYRYDEAFKQEAIALVIEKHIPLSNAAKQLGVAEETLRQWIAKSGVKQQADEQKSDAQRIRELERDLKQARMERDILWRQSVSSFHARNEIPLHGHPSGAMATGRNGTCTGSQSPGISRLETT